MPPALAASYSALGCVSIPLATKPPSERTLQNRQIMRGYFEKQTVMPVLFDLRAMLDTVGLPSLGWTGGNTSLGPARHGNWAEVAETILPDGSYARTSS